MLAASLVILATAAALFVGAWFVLALDLLPIPITMRLAGISGVLLIELGLGMALLGFWLVYKATLSHEEKK